MNDNEIVASVNIERPLPIGYPSLPDKPPHPNEIKEGSVYDQHRQLAYIEPLREKGQISVNSSYLYNKKIWEEKGQVAIGPGFKYRFWFSDTKIAKDFAEEFHGTLEIPPILPNR